jgi:cation diffusion facilitator family transporter
VRILNPKEKVAFFSVVAAIGLVGTKIIVAIWTNSLGILSEALHSSIDLIAAFVTLAAVRMSERPADSDHHYGHEKIESLSSLFETALLFVTCAWIVYEAIHRLISPVEVDVTYIAIGVMVFSIIVDYTRSKALHKMAVRYKSQALEADAIHFSTDLISSAVVIIGIMVTMAATSGAIPIEFRAFDSISALGVGVITAVIGYRLWKRSIHTLMDGAPEGISELVADEAMRVKEIRGVNQVRVRETGPTVYIDCTVLIDKVVPLEQAHRVTDEFTNRIRKRVDNAVIMVNAEPFCVEPTDLVDKIRAEAADFKEIKTVHNINVSEFDNDTGDELEVDFHLELDGDLSLDKAHTIATRLENRIKTLDQRITQVTTHIEPADCHSCGLKSVRVGEEGMARSIKQLVATFPEIEEVTRISVQKTEGKIRVGMCCSFGSRNSVKQAHDVAEKLEGVIRVKHPEVDVVSIHMEPSHQSDLANNIVSNV